MWAEVVNTHKRSRPGAAAGESGWTVKRSPDGLPWCLYLSGSLVTTRRDTGTATLHLFNDQGDAQAEYPLSPQALAVDYHYDTLYSSNIASIDRYSIGNGLSAGDKYCTCSFSTQEVNVFNIQTMAVEQTSGDLYFGFYNEVCYKAFNESLASCYIWPESLVPSSDVLQYFFLDQDSQRLFMASKVGGWMYYANTNKTGTDDWLALYWGSPDYYYDYYAYARFSGITQGPDPGTIYATVNAFTESLSPTDSIDSQCIVIEVTIPEGDNPFWGLWSCWEPTLADRATMRNPFFLHYYNDYFYTFIPDDPTIASPNSLMKMRFNRDPTFDYFLLLADDWEWFITGVNSPADMLWAPCPYFPSPSPSVTPRLVHSSGTPVAAIAAPVVLGVALVFFIVLFVLGLLLWQIFQRRRKYYAAQEVNDEEMGELGASKFTYREIDFHDLKLGRLLGEGAFGKVYKGEYRGAVVAIKLFEALRLDQTDEKVLNELRTEAQMMERLSNHPNIVKFVGAITKGTEGANFALVTEFCSRGSLFDLLVKNKKKLPLITIVRMARDAASGILHLHKEHIVHRDIAARNILVGQNYEVYVADFGLARAAEAEGKVATTKQNFGPISWMAPEALRSREYSEATDAFSFGVLLWEMVERKRPWAGMEAVQIVTAVTSNTRLKIPKDCDPVFRRIMKMCWRQNPAQRPAFDKVVDMLSDYYKTLKQYQDGEAEAFEASNSEDEPDDMGENMTYEEWQSRRIKDEVKSFMKQLISERNDDFVAVAEANVAAMNELQSMFGGDDEDWGELSPLLNSKGSKQGGLSKQAMSKQGGGLSKQSTSRGASGKPIIYDSFNEAKMKKRRALDMKNKGKGKGEGEGESEEEYGNETDRALPSNSTLDSSTYMGLDDANQIKTDRELARQQAAKRGDDDDEDDQEEEEERTDEDDDNDDDALVRRKPKLTASVMAGSMAMMQNDAFAPSFIRRPAAMEEEEDEVPASAYAQLDDGGGGANGIYSFTGAPERDTASNVSISEDDDDDDEPASTYAQLDGGVAVPQVKREDGEDEEEEEDDDNKNGVYSFSMRAVNEESEINHNQKQQQDECPSGQASAAASFGFSTAATVLKDSSSKKAEKKEKKQGKLRRKLSQRGVLTKKISERFLGAGLKRGKDKDKEKEKEKDKKEAADAGKGAKASPPPAKTPVSTLGSGEDNFYATFDDAGAASEVSSDSSHDSSSDSD